MRALSVQGRDSDLRFADWLINLANFAALKILGNVGYFLMKLIDAKKVKSYEKLIEASEGKILSLKPGMELRLLSSANQVRDHARETDDWTDRHTEALNAIGDALMVEIGWQEESVHQYLKSLVESIEGLEYGTDELIE